MGPEGASRRSGSAVVSGRDVELGCDVVYWRCLGDPQERSSRQQLPAEKHYGHACLPCDSECSSLLGCSAAGHPPGPGKRIPLPFQHRAALCGGPSPAQLRGHSSPPGTRCLTPRCRARPRSPETWFQESWHCRLLACPGTSGVN